MVSVITALPQSDLVDEQDIHSWLLSLKDGRGVFNIAGNKYRLVVWINYAYRIVYIRFIGAHAQYDKIDVQNI